MSLQLKKDLCLAYKILAHQKMDDLTYTHLSVRVPNKHALYIIPFGLQFIEASPDNLLCVNFSGEILENLTHQHYNPTGYVIHASIYKHRPDIHAIFHLHTPASIAVSAQSFGLLPISQWALHFYNRISYHPYRALALTLEEHEATLVKDLGDNFTMLLRNHGSLICGTTLHQALFFSHHLELACKTQCMAMHQHNELVLPSHEVCLQTAQQLLNFETDIGLRDWKAWQRYFKNLK